MNMENGHVLGREYEEYYRLSTYTDGGGYFHSTFGHVSNLTGVMDLSGGDFFIVAIFENSNKAQLYIDEYLNHYEDLKVINLKDL